MGKEVSSSRDESLTGEQTVALWHPELHFSFNNPSGLPEGVTEQTKTAGVVVDLSLYQLKVTVPVGGTYILQTDDVVDYINGQETRAMFTTVYQTAPQAGVSAMTWAMSADRQSGIGIGHCNGDWCFGWRYDGNDDFIVLAPVSLTDENGATVQADYTAPQIHRLRMLYLGFGPLLHEIRNIEHTADPRWVEQYARHFVNDTGRLIPNLSDPDLGLVLEIINNGSDPAIVRSNSWSIGPVLGDRGENSITAGKRGTTNQQTVTTAPVILGVAVSKRRRAIRLKCLSTSARPMFYGFDSGLSTSNGDELAAGEAVTVWQDEGVPIYVITTSTAGSGVRCSWSVVAG